MSARRDGAAMTAPCQEERDQALAIQLAAERPAEQATRLRQSFVTSLSRLTALRHRPATPAWIRTLLRRLEQRLASVDAAELEPYRWEWLSVTLTRFLSFTLSKLPMRIAYPLCDRLADVLYCRLHAYRETVHEHLRQVYRGRIDDARLERQSRLVFRTIVRTSFDVVTIPYLEQADFERGQRVAEGSWEKLDEIVARGDGVVLISGHLGPFDFMGQLLAYRDGYHPLILTLPTVSKMVFTAISFLRASKGFRIASLNASSMREVIMELRAGHIVAMVADRDFTGGGHEVSFFGRTTTLPVGPVRLAMATGAPIVPMFAIRTDLHSTRRTFDVYIGEPRYIEQTGNRAADIERGLEQMVKIYERYISLAPEQWVMYQPVWMVSASAPDHAVSSGRPTARPDRDGSNGSAVSVAARLVPPDAAAPGLERRPAS